MSITTQTAPLRGYGGGILTLPRRAEAWLDARGRKAWIAAMVGGFIVFWPVGLALVAYITLTDRWSNRMFGQSTTPGRTRPWGAPILNASSGNSAFDAYKAETLRRLEEEQAAFEGFLQRLREAKDKSEFDAFMQDRSRQVRGPQTGEQTGDQTGDQTGAAQTDA